jgi:hypothetical protein
MNIFVLDLDPEKAAYYHCDKHVVKMILESVQMLSTVLGGPYKPTHQHHPCTKWVAESYDNASWLVDLTRHLDAQYRRRYDKMFSHKSWRLCQEYSKNWDTRWLPHIGVTPFALAMPDEYKTDDPVESYRAYYKSKTFAEWKHVPKPYWW